MRAFLNARRRAPRAGSARRDARRRRRVRGFAGVFRRREPRRRDDARGIARRWGPGRRCRARRRRSCAGTRRRRRGAADASRPDDSDGVGAFVAGRIWRRAGRARRAREVGARRGRRRRWPAGIGGRPRRPAAAGAEAHVRARPRGVVAVGGVRGEDECVDGSPVRARVEANRGELGEAARYRSRARVVVEDVVRPGRAHRGHPPGRRAHGDDPALLVRALELAQERALIMEHRVQQPRAAEIWREGMAGESAALDAHRSRDEGARDASSAAPTRARVCVPTRSFSGTQLNGMHISREMVLQAGEEVPCIIAQLNVIGVI